ncbi:hypothetical protein GN956_G15914 [Arapaima gigas]
MLFLKCLLCVNDLQWSTRSDRIQLNTRSGGPNCSVRRRAGLAQDAELEEEREERRCFGVELVSGGGKRLRTSGRAAEIADDFTERLDR